MTTMSLAARDSATMLRRDFKHTLRYPLMTISSVFMPIIMLLLFVYVFGGAISTGLGSATGGSYLDFVLPGILVMTVGSGCGATAMNISADMHEGIVNRFRTMSIARSSVLIGQVAGAAIRIMLALVVVIGVALLMGFRSSASPLDWLAVFGVLMLLVIALTWLSVALGMNAKTAGGANSATMPVQFLLPFISGAFVSTESMPGALGWFAEHQPFTPVIDTLRGLLLDQPIGNDAYFAVGWCLLITAAGYLWARKIYNRAA